jgi:tRNA-specific adenosine deaminase 1
MWNSAEIYHEVSRMYDDLPQNGKPSSKVTNPTKCQRRVEYTVIAAIVARIKKFEVSWDYIVISLSTGTKCSSSNQLDDFGVILHDSHAEVLARRGFLHYMMTWMIQLQCPNTGYDDDKCPIIRNPTYSALSNEPRFLLKETWQFALYISDSPCGDASIYPTISGDMNFTGAKLVSTVQLTCDRKSVDKILFDYNNNNIVSDANDINNSSAMTTAVGNNLVSNRVSAIDIPIRQDGCCLRETDLQLLGCMRLKTGRSDIQHRSQSKSCSDKLCRWLVLGLQGSLLYPWIGYISLSAIIVGKDPTAKHVTDQQQALQRALYDRIQELLILVPAEHVETTLLVHAEDEEQFACSKAQTKYHHWLLQRQQQLQQSQYMEDILVPCSTSLNWIRHPSVTVTVNASQSDSVSAVSDVNQSTDSVIRDPSKKKRKYTELISAPSKPAKSSTIPPLSASLPSLLSESSQSSQSLSQSGSVEILVAQSGVLQGSAYKKEEKLQPGINDILTTTNKPAISATVPLTIPDNTVATELVTTTTDQLATNQASSPPLSSSSITALSPYMVTKVARKTAVTDLAYLRDKQEKRAMQSASRLSRRKLHHLYCQLIDSGFGYTEETVHHAKREALSQLQSQPFRSQREAFFRNDIFKDWDPSTNFTS